MTMKVDYDALSRAAACMASAASQVRSERSVPGGLGAGASRPDEAYADAVGGRGRLLHEFGELLHAQSGACDEVVALFRLLDAQIAGQVPGV